MISLFLDPKPFCDTCHGSWEIQISEGVTVTAFHCNLLVLGRHLRADGQHGGLLVPLHPVAIHVLLARHFWAVAGHCARPLIRTSHVWVVLGRWPRLQPLLLTSDPPPNSRPFRRFTFTYLLPLSQSSTTKHSLRWRRGGGVAVKFLGEKDK